MESAKPYFKLTHILRLILATAFFCGGVTLAYFQDKSNSLKVFELADSYLTYAFELKDDMALIDVSKKLEALPDVLAFRAIQNSKVITEGGNRNYLLAIKPQGISFSFPSRWSFHVTRQKNAQNSFDFMMVCNSTPGPFLWGIYFFLTSFLSALIVPALISFLTSAKLIKTKSPTINHRPVSTMAEVSVLKDKPNAYLFLDKNYVIREVSPQTAALLGTETKSLLNGHLLDLSPDPALMQAIEKGQEVKLLKPFYSLPNLSVRLKMESDGTVLIFENAMPVEAPQKH